MNTLSSDMTNQATSVGYNQNDIENSLIEVILFYFRKYYTIILIILPIVYFFSIIISKIKDKYDEMNLFNPYYMTDEEKKLFTYTQKLTFINQKYNDKSVTIQANKGKIYWLILIFSFK